MTKMVKWLLPETQDRPSEGQFRLGEALYVAPNRSLLFDQEQQDSLLAILDVLHGFDVSA